MIHENDHYDRKELIRTTCAIFGEEITEEELEKRAMLWYMADHAGEPDFLEKYIDIFQKLSKMPYVEVRDAVAQNENAPVDVLTELSQDESWEIRESVAYHKNTPQNILDILANDENENVRQAVKMRK
ncbi:MAG TPA: hypothetical protein DCO72_08170 [Ruminococcus sp.]|jgi:hypothetical protein|nr:hypothetical protein [Ruminococcus sp.]